MAHTIKGLNFRIPITRGAWKIKLSVRNVLETHYKGIFVFEQLSSCAIVNIDIC